MFKSWIRAIILTIQARSGASPAMFVWDAVIAVASLTAFIFLCLALYLWLSLQLGAVIASLVVAGIFVAIAVVGAIICGLVRRRVRRRAIVERAALSNSPPSLLDPKLFATALQAGRALGWQRIVPIVLLGFMATQWTREHRENRDEGGAK
jgi:Na+/proline symporter